MNIRDGSAILQPLRILAIMICLTLAAVLFPPTSRTSAQRFTHTTSSSNITANYTLLSADGLDKNPNAIVIVSPVGNARVLNPHPIGVWYTGSQWSIFNQDRARMPEGVKYDVVFYPSPSPKEFVHRVTANNLQNRISYIDHPLLNNNPSADFQVTQNWNPGGQGGVYNASDIVVSYSQKASKWYASNNNQSSLPRGAAINIVVNDKGSAKSNPITENPIISHKPLVSEKAVVGEKPIISKKPATIEKPGISDQPVISKDNPKNATPNPASNKDMGNVSAGVIANSKVLASALFGTNLGFENGLLGWTATGTAFANQPVQGNTVTSERVLTQMWYNNGGIGGDYWKGMIYPIGIKGENWIGTYEDGNGDAPTGTLTSSPFRANKRYLHFLLGGGKDLPRIYVELQVKKQDYEAAWGPGRASFYGETPDGFSRVDRITPLINSEELFRYWFDLDAELNHAYRDKTIRICVVDDSDRSWGHINVDDFQQSDDVRGFVSFMRGGFSLFADNDRPVWGFADTHAHWVNHVGLRGLMHGTPGGNWRTSDIRNDIPSCDGFNHNLPTITPGMLIAQTEKAAFRRIPERLADPGNAACIGGVVVTGVVFWPSGLATVGGAGLGAAFGALGSAASEAKGSTGALDGLITGTVWGLASNAAFQACGYQFSKDVFAKHYNNNVPANRPEVSNYVDFPRWNSFFHQTMHITQVRRSYEGGQRLMVVPVGVAKSWEFSTFRQGDNFRLAKSNIEAAVAELKRIVAANNDWMAIADTPRKAREIILSGRMAVVIALEQAEVGSYFERVEDEMDWLDHLGIRHVFPIHNVDNRLGGAAVFNSALNSYNDLVNRISPNAPIVALRVREGNSNDETRTNVKLDRTFMRQDFRYLPVAGFGNIPFFYSNDVPRDYDYERFTAHKNSQGLTLRGESYITGLMKKGMIIDVDHMSDLSQDRAMQMLRAANYPMISGHTNFRELRREEHGTGGDKEPRLKTEFTIFDSRASEINNSGGMFGLMTQQNNILQAAGSPIANNAAGGTPSFAQAYWYALQKTGGSKGIAFGTDFNGFAPQTAPRFGVDAGYFLEGDDVLNTKITNGARDEETQRRAQAFAQRNGVRYDVPVKTYHYHRFLKPPFLTSEEREIWEAIAIAKSGTQPTAAWQPGGGLSVERTGLQQDKIRNLAEGFQARPVGDFLAFLDCPEYPIKLGNDCMPERKAAFMAVYGESILPATVKDARTMELFRVVKPIYDLWKQFENGPNEPLRRNFAYPGGRDFDFNLDGLAHYGLLPDMIQDMKNIGLTPAQLQPLFMGPEEYIRMWEKSVAASSAMH